MSDFKIKVCVSSAKKHGGGGVNLQQLLSAQVRWGRSFQTQISVLMFHTKYFT